VTEGDVIDVDLRDLADDAKELQFEKVLLVSQEGSVKVGTPLVDGAKVTASIVEAEAKGPKVQIYRWRRRKNSRRKTGPRQKYVRVQVTKIEA
jgi:large subunit ribosomal protein L21